MAITLVSGNGYGYSIAKAGAAFVLATSAGGVVSTVTVATYGEASDKGEAFAALMRKGGR